MYLTSEAIPGEVDIYGNLSGSSVGEHRDSPVKLFPERSSAVSGSLERKAGTVPYMSVPLSRTTSLSEKTGSLTGGCAFSSGASLGNAAEPWHYRPMVLAASCCPRFTKRRRTHQEQDDA